MTNIRNQRKYNICLIKNATRKIVNKNIVLNAVKEATAEYIEKRDQLAEAEEMLAKKEDRVNALIEELRTEILER
ncbi:MAG TPA: hypothetical protein VES96_01340 [Nitrospiraceae bacterium]|nr:hypothetical protein [Nitrospiraceae bacterium]